MCGCGRPYSSVACRCSRAETSDGVFVAVSSRPLDWLQKVRRDTDGRCGLRRRTVLVRSIVSFALMLGSLGVPHCLGQTLSPVEGGLAQGERRQVIIVTLTRRGFEPAQLTAKAGKLTILLRDLTGGNPVPLQLRQNSKSGPLLQSRARSGPWRLVDEIQLVIEAGEYSFGLDDGKAHAVKIIVGGK